MRVMSDLEYSHVVARQERQEIKFSIGGFTNQTRKRKLGLGGDYIVIRKKATGLGLGLCIHKNHGRDLNEASHTYQVEPNPNQSPIE